MIPSITTFAFRIPPLITASRSPKPAGARSCVLPAQIISRSPSPTSQTRSAAMTTESGLPRRSWFKHQIYAPGFYPGYGVKTLPGIREALEQHKWDEASDQISIVATTIEQTAAQIDRLAAILRADH